MRDYRLRGKLIALPSSTTCSLSQGQHSSYIPTEAVGRLHLLKRGAKRRRECACGWRTGLCYLHTCKVLLVLLPVKEGLQTRTSSDPGWPDIIINSIIMDRQKIQNGNLCKSYKSEWLSPRKSICVNYAHINEMNVNISKNALCGLMRSCSTAP